MVRAREHLARNLQQHAKVRGLSQSDVSRLTGMQETQVRRLFRGAHAPTLDTLDELAKALGLSVAELVAPEPAAPTSAKSTELMLIAQISQVLVHFLLLDDRGRKLFAEELGDRAKRDGKET